MPHAAVQLPPMARRMPALFRGAPPGYRVGRDPTLYWFLVSVSPQGALDIMIHRCKRPTLLFACARVFVGRAGWLRPVAYVAVAGSMFGLLVAYLPTYCDWVTCTTCSHTYSYW